MQNFKKLLDEVYYYKPSDSDIEQCDKNQIKKFLCYVELITMAEMNEEAKILFRGTKLKKLNSKLISKLNSNNSLYDGLFLVGEKAKNYLKKENEIPHPIKTINTTCRDTTDWIYDEYKKLPLKNIGTDYFQDNQNKNRFSKELEKDSYLIDYYLKGLHTWNSDFLVNFVSASSSFKVALNQGNDLVIILWMSDIYSKHVLSPSFLKQYEKVFNKKKLPKIKKLFKDEQEYSFKGFILPHYILGAYIKNENKIVINPALLENNKENWIQDGFDIDGEKFSKFIKHTKYERFLMLHNNEKFEEKNVY
ncbi:MAG TPA: hypothetical protein PLF32_06230 [Bacteroidales bacterium]|nr:hypothetical protein [Bacteroidales bacterium]HOR82235.1 hypothetical protein [Bacteroidales bacterium]HPJ91553.1 hypothetical protein [Bacteroidales bacterium]